MFPDKFKKLYALLNDLGKNFEEIQKFDEVISGKISYPYNLSDYSKFQRGLIKVSYKLKLSNLGWNMMLKRNDAFNQRFDKPFNS